MLYQADLMMNRFQGKTILITGAGSGIGAACVRRLFAEGASVVAADVRKDDVDRVVGEFAGSDRVYSVGESQSAIVWSASSTRHGVSGRCTAS